MNGDFVVPVDEADAKFPTGYKMTSWDSPDLRGELTKSVRQERSPAIIVSLNRFAPGGKFYLPVHDFLLIRREENGDER